VERAPNDSARLRKSDDESRSGHCGLLDEMAPQTIASMSACYDAFERCRAITLLNKSQHA
jgi:hypothetical protein